MTRSATGIASGARAKLVIAIGAGSATRLARPLSPAVGRADTIAVAAARIIAMDLKLNIF
jgi:hypothetical protein